MLLSGSTTLHQTNTGSQPNVSINTLNSKIDTGAIIVRTMGLTHDEDDTNSALSGCSFPQVQIFRPTILHWLRSHNLGRRREGGRRGSKMFTVSSRYEIRPVWILGNNCVP